MNKIIWLDSASSTKPHFFGKDYAQYWVNPNSNHAAGLEANNQLNQARERIMKALGVNSGKVLFCRCATEAVEWLCRKFDENSYGNIIACSKYEHDSCYDEFREYKIDSFIEYVKDGYEGLYLHQYVNQLTGTMFPIEPIGKQVQSTGAFFGSDFTAAIGHYPLPDNLDSFCDAVWFSGHKFVCEPGIGAIWLSDRLFEYLGGKEDSRNEYGLIHGTPNVSAAVAMSYAMEHAIDEAWVMEAKTQNLVFHLQRMLDNNNIECHVVCDDQPKTYAINALYLPNINGDALTQYLSTKSIYISPGHSACAENDDYRVLEAFGLTNEQASQTVRISFGEDTTEEDIDALVKGILEFKELFV